MGSWISGQERAYLTVRKVFVRQVGKVGKAGKAGRYLLQP